MKRYFALLGMVLPIWACLTSSAAPVFKNPAAAESSTANKQDSNTKAAFAAAPSVVLTSPRIGAVVNQNETLTITADATDQDGTVSKVEFYVNNNKVGEDTSSPYSVTWSPAAAGDHTLTAKAFDNAGGSSSSAPIKISILEWGQRIVRILPLGNSLTYDDRVNDTRGEGDRPSYRFKLAKMLKDAGYSVDFVGSRYTGFNLFTDANNGGIPGIRDDQMARMLETGFNARDGKQETPGPYLETYPADIILLHIGTNQVDPNPADVENILNQVDKYEAASKSQVTVILAQIANRVSGAERDVTTAFNRNIKAMAEARIAKGDKIVLVDMENGAGLVYALQPDGDMADNLHPNESGYEKMATVWFNALKNVLGKPTGISDPASPESLVKMTVSPNPFQNELNVQVQSPGSKEAVLELYDIGGKRIAELFNGSIQSNRTLEIRHTTNKLASGMYIAKLRTEHGVVTRKLILQR